MFGSDLQVHVQRQGLVSPTLLLRDTDRRRLELPPTCLLASAIAQGLGGEKV